MTSQTDSGVVNRSTADWNPPDPRLPLSTLESWRLLFRTLRLKPAYEKRGPQTTRGRLFDTKVFHVTRHGEELAVKIVRSSNPYAKELAFREHRFLQAILDRSVASYRGHLTIGDRYVLITDWIDGFCLEHNADRLRTQLAARGGLESFSRQCASLLAVLRHAGIRHRDIREKNIIVRNGEPVLFDFGWAVWQSERDAFTPPALQSGDDAKAMTDMLSRLAGANAEAAS